MDARLSYALVGLSLMGAFVACDLNAGADAGGDDGGGEGPVPTGPGGGPGTGVGGGSQVDDPDTLIVDEGGDEYGGAGPAGGSGGGGGAFPALSVPQECEGLEYAAPVEFAVAPTDSHSTGSAAYARELLDACQAPAPGTLETSHFLNLHDLGYVRSDEQLDGYLDLVQTEDPYLFVVQGAAVAGADLARPAVHLTFLVDTSGSTLGGAMARQVSALEATKAQLAAGDSIAIYGWSSNAVLVRTNGDDQSAVQAAIDALSTENDYDGALSDGLRAALDSATAELGSDGEHSLVVLTDGGEPISASGKSTLVEIGSESRLSFLGVGVGPAEQYSPALLREMTSLAGGKLYFLGGATGFDAQSLFGDGFQRMFNVAARNAYLEVTMPAYFEIEETPKTTHGDSVGVLRERTLAPGGTLLFRQLVRVCHPDIVNLAIEPMSGVVTFDRPAFGVTTGATSHLAPVSVTFPLSIASDGPNPAANAEALLTFADALRGPVSARLGAASSFIEGSTSADPALRTELGQLLLRHPNHPTTECVPQ